MKHPMERHLSATTKEKNEPGPRQATATLMEPFMEYSQGLVQSQGSFTFRIKNETKIPKRRGITWRRSTGVLPYFLYFHLQSFMMYNIDLWSAIIF